ncbi:MAG: [Fe-S]-binding protein, partial [Bryobacteraceae bacterium]
MIDSSAAERALLIALICLSVALFAARFGPVLGHILRSRPEPDFRWGRAGRRIWNFFWEVLCQAKVIRERPWPGIAHAFVFWGFLAFVIVTSNHIASGLGVPFLSRSGFGAFYFWFAFVFALFCAAAIAGLAFRRFVLRPRWLGPLSTESGVIALFIFILMVTYMPMWWVREDSAAGHALWWVHTLTLLAFLPLIPHTKH